MADDVLPGMDAVTEPPAVTIARLKAALGDVLDAMDTGHAPANRVRHWRELAGREKIPGDKALTPEQRADDGIARASAKWTDDEAAQVDRAIARIAARGYEFTTADVWEYLAGRVPITKGIAGRFKAAQSAGVIVNTGRVVIAPPNAPGPNHGQRLTVWAEA
ncbi:MAG: hypothetical protein RR101_15160 [Burkholderiaceae bacterium]